MPASARRRLLIRLLLALLACTLIAGGWFYWQLKRSLPLLDGETTLAGLTAPVTIERDAIGVPTITGTTREDVARALGFLHAQDRFFQMDLARRKSAGELSALFGKAALPLDRAARIHSFSTVARATFAALPAHERALLEAYTTGVNTGLAQLRSRPFEYLILRSKPQPWRAEDCVLVAYSMWLDLQDSEGRYERTLSTLRDQLGTAAVNFFSPLIAPDDVAFDGSTAPLPASPSARILDLRKRTASAASSDLLATHYSLLATPQTSAGSNSLALAGAHTATGAAMLASDMHLSLRVPNTWYRASLIYNSTPPASASSSDPVLPPNSPSSEPQPSAFSLQPSRVRATGVTLPGIPLIIAGSNGHIAWGFTNANADTVDLVAITASDIDRAFYILNGAILPLPKRLETISVRGSASVTHEILTSPWGPIVGENAKGQRLALKWTAHDPAATNFSLLELEAATTAAAALTIAQRAGIPPQNFLVADSTGTIGWTIAGKLPRRIGYDGRLPVTMSFGDRRWEGYVPESQLPVILHPGAIEQLHPPSTNTPAFSTPSSVSDAVPRPLPPVLSPAPPSPSSDFHPSPLTFPSSPTPSSVSRISTANQRLIGGDSINLLGDGGYEPPHRAARIRELLSTVEKAKPADLLAIQLDTRAPHLDRWQQLLVRTLTADTTVQRESRAALLAVVSNWQGRATPDSASYTLVRSFSRQVATRALTPIFAGSIEQYPDFNFHLLRYQPALWQLVDEQPVHLLDPAFATWTDLLFAAADGVLADLKKQRLSPAEATWSRFNISKIEHPLSRVLPGLLARPLNLPAESLPGDHEVPRVQSRSFGASERFVISPGHEADAIFHMPAGQSAHPLSPFYRAGHEAWTQGKPTPFLPGPPEHTLTLKIPSNG